MQTYIGAKIINAKPMTRGEYNKYRYWTIPANENDEGYLVIYDNNYRSWLPKQIFETTYRPITLAEFNLQVEPKE